MKKLLFIPLLYVSISLLSCSTSGYVTTTPVQPVYERPPSPGVGYIWIDGDWSYEGNNYVWHEGRWGTPRGSRHWQSGVWQKRGNGFRWHRGGWHR
jgi:hypothetical protein